MGEVVGLLLLGQSLVFTFPCFGLLLGSSWAFPFGFSFFPFFFFPFYEPVLAVRRRSKWKGREQQVGCDGGGGVDGL